MSFLGVRAPDVVTRGWRHILGLMQPVQIYLGDKMAGDRCRHKQERHHQNFVQRPCLGRKGIYHRRHQQGPDTQCRRLGRRVEPRHAVIELDQPDRSDEREKPAYDQQGRDDDFGD